MSKTKDKYADDNIQVGERQFDKHCFLTTNTDFENDNGKVKDMKENSQPRNAFRNLQCETFPESFDNVEYDQPVGTESQTLSSELHRMAGKSWQNIGFTLRRPKDISADETEDCLTKGSEPKDKKPDEKEKKTITTKTFAHGMMDVSLLTSNATQLRSVLSNPEHEFYQLLVWLIVTSIVFQIISGVLLIMSDFYKTQVKEKDQQNQRKRKLLNFIALAMVMVITAMNILISAFYPTTAHETVHVTRAAAAGHHDMPSFSPSDYYGASNRTEL